MKVRQLMLIGIESSHPGLFLLFNSLVNPHQQSMQALWLNPLILRDLPRSYSPPYMAVLSWITVELCLRFPGFILRSPRVDLIKSQQLILSMRDPNSTSLWWNKFVGFFAMDSATTMCLDYSVLSRGFGQFLYCWLVYISTAWVWCNELWESLSKIILCISTDCECLITVPN